MFFSKRLSIRKPVDTVWDISIERYWNPLGIKLLAVLYVGKLTIVDPKRSLVRLDLVNKIQGDLPITMDVKTDKGHYRIGEIIFGDQDLNISISGGSFVDGTLGSNYPVRGKDLKHAVGRLVDFSLHT